MKKLLVLVVILLVSQILVGGLAKASPLPLDGMIVSLPAGTVVGPNPDPWLDQGWLLNLNGVSADFTVTIERLWTPPYRVRILHLIIAICGETYNNLKSISVYPVLGTRNLSLSKDSFQYGIPQLFSLASWSDDVYPAWYADILLGDALYNEMFESAYLDVMVHVELAKGTANCARFHFDAYGTITCDHLAYTNVEDIVGNPSSKDSTVILCPPTWCTVTFLTDPVGTGFNITFQGSTYHDGDADIFSYGTSASASASYGVGYVFDHWEVSGNVAVSSVTGNPTCVTITCGGTLKAVFKPVQCCVIFLTDPVCSNFNITFQGSTYHNGSSGVFSYGTSGLATAYCPVGYVFDHWVATGNIEISSTTANPTCITIKCGGTLKAVFRIVCCLVTFLTDPVGTGFNITFQGSTYHNGDTGTFVYGTSGQATANCGVGYVFDHWEVSGNVAVSSVTGNPTCVTITCGGTLKAVFKYVQCTVVFLTDPVCSNFNITFQGGTYHNGSSGTFAYGTSGSATAHCDAGYVFDHWEVTGNVQVSSVTANPTTVTVTCGGTLKAVCKSTSCLVTFLTDPVGTGFNITFQGSTYHNGDTGTFVYGTSGQATANCGVGYVFDHWEVTGNVQVSSVTANPTTVTVTCGGTLKAVCKCTPCTVVFLTDPVSSLNFYITFEGSTYHNGSSGVFSYGTSGLATAHCPAPPGYVFSHWATIGNVQVSSITANPTTVTITCGGYLKAVFELCTLGDDPLFLTDPVGPDFNVTFEGSTYHNGSSGVFSYGTSGLATAYCPAGYVFDHWEVTGNITVSSATANPTTLSTLGIGTLKAVYRLLEDLNDDGIINIIDVAKIAKAMGSKLGDPGWNEKLDLNQDGTVNIIDIAVIGKGFGKSTYS